MDKWGSLMCFAVKMAPFSPLTLTWYKRSDSWPPTERVSQETFNHMETHQGNYQKSPTHIVQSYNRKIEIGTSL